MRRGVPLIKPVTGPWTPASLPSLAGWWDASNAASITSSAGLVSQWNDLSGLSNHLTASGAARPTTGVDTVNGLNAMKFSGAQVMGQTSFSAKLTPITWLAVIKLTALVTDQAIVGSGPAGSGNGNDGGLEWRIASTTGVQDLLKQNIAGIGSSSTSVGSGSAVRIGALRVDGGSYSVRLAGAADGSGTSAATYAGTGSLIVGAQRTGDFMTGDICELIGCIATLAGTDLSSAESYLATKWGTP